MATKAGDIYIEITAEFAKVNDQLTKLGNQVRALSEQSRGHFEAFAKAGDLAKTALGSLGVAMSVGAAIEFVKNVVETTTQLGNLADQISINVETLQELAQVGQQFGLSSDQIGAGLERLTRSVGEAAADNKALAQTFDELGISVRDQANNIRPTEDILNDFADVMATIPDAATRAKYETELLGKGAQALDPILRQGSGALKEMEGAARDAGGVIGKDTVDALREMSRATDDAKDRLHANAAKMIADWKDVWLAIVNIGPAIDAMNAETQHVVDNFNVYKKVVDLTKEEAALQKQIADVQAGSTPNKFGGVIAQHTDLKALQDRLAAVHAQLAQIGEDAKTATGHIADIPRELLSPPVGETKEAGAAGGRGASTSTAADQNAAAIAKVVAQLQAENEALTQNDQQQQLSNALRQAGVGIKSEAGQQIAALVDLNQQLTAQQAEQNRLEADAAKVREVTMTVQEKYNLALDDLNKELERGLINQQQFTAAQENLRKAVADADPAIKEAAAAQAEFQSAVEDAAGSLLTDLGRAFTDSGSAADRWKNLLSHAIQDVMGAFDGLLKKLAGSAVNSLLGDLGGTTLGSLFGGTSGAILGPLAGSPMLMASGGSMGVGDWAIVGEAGPELVYADTPGNVLSASRTRGVFGGGGEGGGNVAYIDARGADIGAVARLEKALQVMNYSFEHRAISAITNERRRGGAFSATFNR